MIKLIEIISNALESKRKQMIDCIFEELMKDLIQVTINHVASKIKIGEKIDTEEVLQDIRNLLNLYERNKN